MSRTYRRPPIKQHEELTRDGKYRSRVEKNKKKENKNKHPKRDLEEIVEIKGDYFW